MNCEREGFKNNAKFNCHNYFFRCQILHIFRIYCFSHDLLPRPDLLTDFCAQCKKSDTEISNFQHDGAKVN